MWQIVIYLSGYIDEDSPMMPVPVPERPLSPIYAATTNIQPMVTIYDRYSIKTRTKTSIRYAKVNDREKRERRREGERKVQGEI